MTGHIHSFQSLGTVDGPGVRCVIFLQGCPLRCACCHNPDTWDPHGGTVASSEELVRKVMRFRSYFGTTGGVTVSGGEPLLQASFVTELFDQLKQNGIHTALDTSGCLLNVSVQRLLDVTDLVLLDYKYANPEDYFRYTGQHQSSVECFLHELERRQLATWIRRVIIPTVNDDETSQRQLDALPLRFDCIKRVERLPFRKICITKYEAMGIPFPFADKPEG